MLAAAYLERCRAQGVEPIEGKLEKERTKLGRAPTVVIVAVEPQSGAIPTIEQVSAVAAATQNMLLAATALGVGSMWRTGEPCYDPRVREAIDLPETALMLGFIYLGTAPDGVLQGTRARTRRGRDRAPTHARCATSLNDRNTGPRRPIAIRVIDAGSRCVRHATSGPTPSAHATAALIGDTWLTTTTVPALRLVAQVVARLVHTASELCDRFTPRRCEVAVGSPLLPHRFGYVRDGQAVELAVVELGPSFVGLHRKTEHLCGLDRVAQRTRHDAVDRSDGSRDSPRLFDAEQVEGRIVPAEQQTRRVRLGSAVTDDDEHRSGTDDDAAAGLAVHDRVGRLVADALDFHGRERRVTSRARGADELADRDAVEPRSQPLVLLEQRGRDRASRLGPLRFRHGELGDHDLLGRVEVLLGDRRGGRADHAAALRARPPAWSPARRAP